MNKNSITITPKKLSQKDFARYGDVIEVNDQSNHFNINDGFTTRYNDLADINVNAEGGSVLVNIFRSTPLAQPISIQKMERHPLSSQCFIPMGSEPYLVVVAPSGVFDERAVQVFIASSNQGVNYHAGTWHHFSLALNRTSDFLVIDRGGSGNNCDEETLKVAIQIGLAPELNNEASDD